MATTSKIQQATSNGTGITATGDTSVISAPGAGLHLEILDVEVTNASATASLVHLKAGSGSLVYPSQLTANWPNNAFTFQANGARFVLPSNTALNLNQTAAGTIHYTIDYYIVPDSGS